MSIPDYQTLMRPVLELHADGAEHAAKSVATVMADQFALTAGERAELLPSGRQTMIANRVHWAVTYLVQAGTLDRPRRAVSVITERGKDLLADTTGPVNVKVLEQFPEFQAFRARTRTRPKSAESGELAAEPSPPAEAIPVLVAETHAVLAIDLVDRLRKASPEFFERCVLQLLVKMGYGGIEGDAEHLGGPGDGGFDGMVRKDPLGFDVVYTQAKRYADHTVGSQEVQAFVGALHGRHADRGVFITTSSFSRAAAEYAKTVPTRIVLIDGERLGHLMVDYGCGVRDAETIVIKEIDEDFFDLT